MKFVKVLVVIIILIVIAFLVFLEINLSNVSSPEVNEKNLETSLNEKENKNKSKNEITLDVLNKEEKLAENKILLEIPEELKIKEILLPDDTVIEEKIEEYAVHKNGKYKFVFTLEDNSKIEKEIEINNLLKLVEEEKKPTYIPEGFEYLTGTVDTGYVITDQYGNEFVWVPVESGILTRKNSKKSNYAEKESSAKALVNSVAKNYGFYISRYEAGKAELENNIIAVSFKGIVPWYNATYKEALEKSEEFCSNFGYNDVSSDLVSSYAWDTTLKWIDSHEKSYSSSLEYGNYSDEIKLTGETEKDCVNNICDMAGNLKEWTTELYLGKNEENNTTKKEKENTNLRVIRGGCVNLKKSASSNISFAEDLTDNYWGFRIILYK